ANLDVLFDHVRDVAVPSPWRELRPLLEVGVGEGFPEEMVGRALPPLVLRRRELAEGPELLDHEVNLLPAGVLTHEPDSTEGVTDIAGNPRARGIGLDAEGRPGLRDK